MIFNEQDLFKGGTKAFLITESVSEEPMKPKKIKTGRNGRGVILETVLQTADCINRNKRFYYKEAIEFGLNTPYIQERLRTFTWYGEFFHPVNPDPQRQMNYEKGNLSHIIEKVWWDGNVLNGKVHSAWTHTGDDFAGLVEQGCTVGFSMRGIGPVVSKKDKVTYVKSPLYIYCYDTVVHPSHAEAYMTKILSESTDDNINVICESGDKSIFTEIQKEEVNNLLMKENEDYRYVSNIYNLEESKPVFISKDRKYVTKQLNESTDKVVVKIDDFLADEIDKYMTKF